MSGAGGPGRSRGRLPVLLGGLLTCLLAFGAPGVGAQDPAADPTAPAAGAPAGDTGDRLVVRLARPADATGQHALAEAVGGERVSEIRPGVFTLEVPPGEGDQVLRRLAGHDAVAGAERDVRFHRAGIPPNEPCFAGCELSFDNGSSPMRFSQKEMIGIGAIEAWRVTRGDPNILVAVVDTDVDVTHPDLEGKVIVGRDFSGDPQADPTGHGTAVAGIIAAQPDNGIGIAGLGWSTRVLSVRVLDSQGSALASDIARGIRYAADYRDGDARVRVINLSLQQDAEDAEQVSSELAEAIRYAQSKGVVVVAAAGNQRRTQPSYPAHFPGVIGVTAVDHDDATADFANRGTWVDLAAPGVGVLTLAAGCNCWAVPDGTSFSAPFVSASAALVMAAYPGWNADQVALQLKATADRVGATGVDFADGRLNVAAAVSRPVIGSPVSDDAPAPPGPSRGGHPTNPRNGRPDASPGGEPDRSSDVDAGSATPGQPPRANNPLRAGFWLAAADGGVFNYGSTGFFGSTGHLRLNSPVVSVAGSSDGDGYWLAAADGGVFNFGASRFFGSTGDLRLNRPIVGIAATPSGRGYWLVASDGGIFNFGDARFFGSTGDLRLNRPIVGMAATPSGRGYWLVASDGGIFAFGDARFAGSAGAIRLGRPIVGMASTVTGRGYWLVAADGGVFNFGDAAFFGSAAGKAGFDAVGLVATGAGSGYWIATAQGTVFAFGAAPAIGPPAGNRFNRPVVGVAGR